METKSVRTAFKYAVFAATGAVTLFLIITLRGTSLTPMSSEHRGYRGDIVSNTAYNTHLQPHQPEKGTASSRKRHNSPEDITENKIYNQLNDDYHYCRRIAPFQGPFNFTGKSKNPCWWDKETFRCLPYFYVAGFSKSATSDLFFRIERHPQVVKSSKEKHWFDYLRYFDEFSHIGNYTDMFASVAGVIQRDIKEFGYSTKIAGDGTPCYIWFSLYWPCYHGNQNTTEPRFTNPDVIYRMQPAAKVIVILREPADRSGGDTYAVMRLQLLVCGDDFPNSNELQVYYEIVERAVQKYTLCFKRWSYRNCAYNGTLYSETMLRLQEGMYSVFVKDWLQVFPADQMLFLRFEDYIHDTVNVVQKVFSFLGLAPANASTVRRMIKMKPRNTGSHHDIGPMLNTTRRCLDNFYRPFVKELSSLLKDNKYMWHYDNTYPCSFINDFEKSPIGLSRELENGVRNITDSLQSKRQTNDVITSPSSPSPSSVPM